MNPYPAFFSALGLFLTGSGLVYAQAASPGDSLPTRRSTVVIRQSGQGNSATVIQSGNGQTTTTIVNTNGTNTTTVQHDGQSSVTIDQQGDNDTQRESDKRKAKPRKLND
ncbi:hypothetical protein FAES_0067 [Fibrella aestuarina BUZ 2]|uniref:Curlin associated repeat-containing protein n=1 Tax=Fibrella aestuarina BUZ 2 TaxID=1166018 RepID=I0K1S8_9BACT|nr:hypothetical protein [Fibrella aestuarina]CCG98081.1 hypothetical protein FAES_0067 [Fibrella aestuarina BUZ 2]